MCKVQSDQDSVQQQYIFQGEQISLQVRLCSDLVEVNHKSDMLIFNIITSGLISVVGWLKK